MKKETVKKLIWGGTHAISIGLIVALIVTIKTSPLNDLGIVGIKADTEQGTVNFDYSDNNDIKERLNQVVSDNMFCVFMNTNPVFENGYSKGNLLIQNVESNGTPFYVEIVDKKTDELIYRSYEVLPGYKIENAKLGKHLAKGSYDCIAYFNVLDKDTKEVTNTIGLNITIEVKN